MSEKRIKFKDLASKFMELDPDNIDIINMEKGIFNYTIENCKIKEIPLKWSDKQFNKIYATCARKVLANISYTANSAVLKEKIRDGNSDPYILAKMSREELNPEIWESLKEKSLKQSIIKQEVTDDGMFKCNKCKSMKTVYYQMQTRSADEPMTTYVTCTNCGSKWKC